MKTLLLFLCLGASEVEWTRIIAMETGWDDKVVLPDRTRPDLVSEDTAWEVEWCSKWKESFGQAYYYSAITGKKPGILLLIQPGDEMDFVRFMVTVQRLKDPDLQIRWRKVEK